MRRLTLSFVLAIGSIGVGFGQSAAPPNAVKLTKYIFGVSDLDKSVAFYSALGIELNGKVGQPHPLPDFLLRLVDGPKGTKFRNAMMKIPGADFVLELTEFSGMELHPGRPRFQDPGAAMINLRVRDVDAALNAVKKAGTEVVTPGGMPVRHEGNKVRGVLVRDPDGFFVGLAQPDILPVGSGPLVISANCVTVVQSGAKAQVYKTDLGLEMTTSEWDKSDPFLQIAGVAGSQYQVRRVRTPGNTLAWHFYEFKDIDRKPYRLRIPDPGAPAIGLEVRDLDAAAAAFKAAGASVITQGGSIQLPNGDRLAFMRDPSGILVEVAQPAAKK